MTIDAHRITVNAAGRDILAPVSLSVVPGELIALTGPSGSGKTTLLNALSLLVRPAHGTLTVAGAPTNSWGDSQRRRFWREQAAFIFQDFGLIDEESAAYNVMMTRPPFRHSAALKDPRVASALEAVGLDGRGKDVVSMLSGGEKQRVGLARAIYKKASYVFADEPTASLDAQNRATVTELLLQEAERGAAVIVATHDETLATRCDRTIILEPVKTSPGI